MPDVEIYTDGACSGNPGPGGWGAILRYAQHVKEMSGAHEQTTNQRMELQAAISALNALKKPCRVRLYSDSAYLVNAFLQNWLARWQRNGWVNAAGKPVENQDLWVALLDAAARHQVTWVKVRGHADNELNNACDRLARRAIASMQDQASGASVAADLPATNPVE